MKKNKLYGGLVWILSGIALLLYGLLGLTNTDVPGVEELVAFVNSAQGIYLYIGAFIAIFLEGLYFFGSFFPGTSLVLLITILSQTGGFQQFILVMATILFGWICAGGVNILGAKYFSKALTKADITTEALKNNADITWFPAFRANTEVAQVTEGHNPLTVFLASTKIKIYTSLGLAVYASIIPLFIDFQTLENEDGFLGLAILALVNFGVGITKIRAEYKKPVA